MKVAAKPIEMIAWFDTKGVLYPVTFGLTNEDGKNRVIKINRIINIGLKKFGGDPMLVYRFQSIFGN